MDPASRFAGVVAAAAAAYLALGLGCDAVRFVTRTRLPWLPSARPFIAAFALVTVVARMGPVVAAVPPPAERLGGGAGRTPDHVGVAAAVAPTAVAADDQPRPGGRYVVTRGDSLWSIAQRAIESPGAPPTTIASYWPAIYDVNRHVIGGDPDLILPGQVLVLPELP